MTVDQILRTVATPLGKIGHLRCAPAPPIALDAQINVTKNLQEAVK
ncbi:hypothetical protein ACWGNM_29875 [Streptomyces sp. NPDC055796]